MAKQINQAAVSFISAQLKLKEIMTQSDIVRNLLKKMPALARAECYNAAEAAGLNSHLASKVWYELNPTPGKKAAKKVGTRKASASKKPTAH